MKLLRLFLIVTAFSMVFLLTSQASAKGNFQNGIAILLYHHVSDDKTDLPELTATSEEFEGQIKRFYQAGFKSITAEELLAYMSGKNVSLPDKPIVISFDDGYEDNYLNAFPILKKYGFKAIIFMVGVNIDAPNRLSSEQMREMSEYGFEFGAHSLTHSNLTTLPVSELKKETRVCKAAIERATGERVKLFAYPYGSYNLQVLKDVNYAGYEGAVTALSGHSKYGYDHIYLMRRITISRKTNFDLLFERLNNNHPKELLLDYWPEFEGMDAEED